MTILEIARHASTPAPVVANAKPAVIVVGLDDRAKPHASWFAIPNAAAARAAATLMSMYALDIINDDLRDAAKTLPEGRLFDSGRGFVPFVKRAMFDRLVMHLPEKAKSALIEVEANALANKGIEAAAPATETAPRQPISPASLPADWPSVRVGSVVLALDPEGGWWEAVITEDKGDDMFVLTWRDFDDLPPFVRKRDQVALIPKGHTEG